jgi:hypothetical protein
MKKINLLWKVSLIFLVSLIAFSFIYGLIFNKFILHSFLNSHTVQQLAYINLIIHFLISSIFIALAHYSYNRKNGDYISFKDAVYIGLIIFGIGFLFSVAVDLRQLPKYHSFLFYILPKSTVLIIDAIALFTIIFYESLWKIYRKAGYKGWESLVPVYNIIILLEIVDKPSWWTVLYFIPIINIIFSVWVTNLLSLKFGKGTGFTIGLILLPFIFYPILGLSRQELLKYE